MRLGPLIPKIPILDFVTTQLQDDLVVIVSQMNNDKYVHDEEDVHVACRCPNKIPRRGLIVQEFGQLLFPSLL